MSSRWKHLESVNAENEIEHSLNLLEELELRLGTHLEKPGDLDRCRDLAHRIRELKCILYLRSELRNINPSPG